MKLFSEIYFQQHMLRVYPALTDETSRDSDVRVIATLRDTHVWGLKATWTWTRLFELQSRPRYHSLAEQLRRTHRNYWRCQYFNKLIPFQERKATHRIIQID